jgi:hypothetical protein
MHRVPKVRDLSGMITICCRTRVTRRLLTGDNLFVSIQCTGSRALAAGPRPVRQGDRPVKIHLSIDRFEGLKKEIAVLLTDDGTSINFPKKLLPQGSRPGDILVFAIERDTEATKRVAEGTKRVQEELKKRDPGGDIRL